MELEFKCPLSADELKATHDAMLLEVSDWVTVRYPKISLQVFERNIGTLLHLKRQDDACKKCLSVQMCPTQDANRANGKLMADGIVSLWYEPCPQGFKLTANRQYEPQQQKGWKKKHEND